MSWSDILYPGNSERRTQMVRKLTQLTEAMDDNFRATNKLSKYINKQMPTANLAMITVDTSKSLADNANTLVRQIHAVDAIIVQIDDELREQLEPDLYEKITSIDLSFQERIEIGQKVSHVIAGITGVTVTGVVGKLAAKRLTSVIASKAARIAASSLAGAIAGGLAGLAVDVIVGAITGAVERDELESALASLQAMVDEFIPDSDDYMDIIYEVLAEARRWAKHNKN